MLKDLLSIFYPKYCYKCNEIIHVKHGYYCFVCEQQLPYFDNSKPFDNLFHDRLFNKVDICQAYSYFLYQKEGSIQELIHDLKYSGIRDIGVFFGERMAKDILDHIFIMPDVIIPVPMHKRKLKHRGYNQVEWIAEGIGEKLGLEVAGNVALKTKNTSTQTKLNRLDRWDNVIDVFSVNVDLTGKHVFLVDDVFTTGSTIEAMALSCKRANCEKISIATLAIAV